MTTRLAPDALAEPTAPPPPATLDGLTVAAIAVLAFALANLLHEGLGHGGACLLVHGRALEITSVNFECGESGLAPWAVRLVAAGGTLVNLVVAAASLALLRRGRGSGAWRFALWLFGAINAMQGFGYFLFSGVGRVGDWADVVRGAGPSIVWSIVLSVGGFALYWFATARLFALLGALLAGPPETRYGRGRRVALIAYLTGGGLYCVAGLFNPYGFLLLAISAAASSLGGTSGLVWGANFLRRNRQPAEAPPIHVARSLPIVLAAVVAAALFVLVLGPGIRR